MKNFNLVSHITGIIIGAIASYFIFSTNTNSPMDCNLNLEEGKIISVAQAQEMYNTYTDRRANIIENFENLFTDGGTDFKASRYGSYKFELIKNYISSLECINEKIKIQSKGKNSIQSIRFYFAAYPNSDTFINDGSPMVTTNFEGIDMTLKGRSTFMMLPTTKFGNQEKGFMYNLDGDDIQLSEIMLDGASSFTSLIMNEVGLVPPPSSAVENDFTE